MNYLHLILYSLILIIILLLFYCWYSVRNAQNYWFKRGIPSPPAIAFLGSFLSLSTPLPILFLNYFKQFGGLFGVHFGAHAILVFCEPELIKRVMVKDFHLFRNRAEMPRHKLLQLSVIYARSEEWKRVRSMLTPMFTSFKLKKMEHLMEACVDKMINSLESLVQNDPNNSFDARLYMDSFAMNVIGKCAFATDTVEASEKSSSSKGKGNIFIKMSKKLLSFSVKNYILIHVTPDFLFKKLVEWKVEPFYAPDVDFFDNLTRHLVRTRKSSAQINYDLLHLLINAEHTQDNLIQQSLHNDISKEQQEMKDIIGSKYLSEDEIMSQTMSFLIAGYETSAFTLSYCLYELAINPAVQEHLYREIQLSKTIDPSLSYSTLSKLDYLDAVILETLRMYPPVWILNRVASGPLHIEEYNLKLEKNDELVVPVYAIHRSDKYYPNPDQFNPDRFMPENRHNLIPYTYLPFGVGPRNCIGMKFALTEAKLALAQIVDRFEIVRTEQTTDKVEVTKALFMLRTTPTFVGVRKRTDN